MTRRDAIVTLLVMSTHRSRRPSPEWAGWAALAVSITVYAAVSIVMHQPFHVIGLRLRYFDLRIYHLGALRLAHGTALYGAPMLDHLGFTYPPFAALLLAPLAWAPLAVDELTVTGLNLLLLTWGVRRTLMFASPRTVSDPALAIRSTPGRAWAQAAAVAAVALWLEPVSVTLGYGQINLLIMALVVFDLSRPDHARTKGLAIGVAAAIKLTPLLFIPYLLLSGRRRAAGVAALTFVAAAAVGLAVAPRDTAAYWGHQIFQTSKVGNAAAPVNQSLPGAIARFAGTAHPAAGWELLTIAIAAGGLALAVRASRRGDEAAGFSLAALSTLLASPISWSHHWTLAVPALILLARRAHQQRARVLGAAAIVLGLLGYAYLPEIAQSHFGSTRGVPSLLTTDPYPLMAMLVLTACAVPVVRAIASERTDGNMRACTQPGLWP
jgi:alpha-1,2-mannosyltransferase